jgi:hypothetical protein
VSLRLTPLDARRVPPLERAVELGWSSDVSWHVARVDGSRYRVLMTRDVIAGDPLSEPEQALDRRWHLSVSGKRDVPRWAHLVAIAHELLPEVCLVIGVPPRSWWMNLHPHTLHLHELDDPNLADNWRAQAMGHVPS